LSSISGIFIPISIIICLLFFKEYLGTIVLAVGTLIGSIISFIFLIIVAVKRNIFVLHKPDFYSVNVRILFLQLPAKLSSSLLTGLNKVVDQFFAAKLVVGSIAALNYGIKIPMFAIGLTSIAIGNVLLPYFSKKNIENKGKSFNELNKILKYLLIGSIVMAAILIILSNPIIHYIFERNAFTSSDTIVVSKIQQMYILQIPFYLVGITMVKFLTSINKNVFMAFTAFIMVILNYLFNYILIEKIGVYGLALATSMVSVINSLILYIYIKKLNKAYV
jgi:putative peptidoglycan lipid II flippase